MKVKKGLLGFGLVAMLVAVPVVNGGAYAADGGGRRFSMVPSPGIGACLPHAQAEVRVSSTDQNQVMRIYASGLAPNTGYDLFVIESPNKPFGLSWYQSDLETNSLGRGVAEVRGIFSHETFIVSPGGPTATVPPTHTFHLGLWFDDPQVPFNLGCEPGLALPAVTPFNGEQHAGIQVLNTANFPDSSGPLAQL